MKTLKPRIVRNANPVLVPYTPIQWINSSVQLAYSQKNDPIYRQHRHYCNCNDRYASVHEPTTHAGGRSYPNNRSIPI